MADATSPAEVDALLDALSELLASDCDHIWDNLNAVIEVGEMWDAA